MLGTEGWEMRASDEAQRLLRDEVESRGRHRGLGGEDGRERREKEPECGTGIRITEAMGMYRGASRGGGNPALASVCLQDAFNTLSTPGSPARTRSCPGWRW